MLENPSYCTVISIPEDALTLWFQNFYWQNEHRLVSIIPMLLLIRTLKLIRPHDCNQISYYRALVQAAIKIRIQLLRAD